jgi:hypothetical protein
MRKCFFVLGCCAFLASCSSDAEKTQAKSPLPAAPPSQLEGKSNNPAAKYIELVGFRTREKGPGKIEITFGVVNHSEADLGDLSMTVDLRTIESKPADPPVFTFDAKVPSLGPEELKQVSVIVPSKMRVYELPDWQFLRPRFQITEPK